MVRWVALVGFLAVPVFLVAIFGEDVRHLFGASSCALGADVRPRASRAHKSKSLTDFAVPGSSSGLPSIDGFVPTDRDRLSTFAVDVDTGAYGVLRRQVADGRLPAPQLVRVEELLNYFSWGYPTPEDAPFLVHVDGAPSPFSVDRHLLRVGIQGKETPPQKRKPAHLVFLVDVSGSMYSPDKLPLAQKALRLLVDELTARDTVALVTYAGHTRVVLPATRADQKDAIHQAIESLIAGGGTAMADGLGLAYELAEASLRPGEISRVIVLSDGDANLGPSTHEEMLDIIARGQRRGVTLTTVGFGRGDYKDHTMEQLANRGNGAYHYVDSLIEARRLFVEQLGGTLEVIARDVKIQVAFDPAVVNRYRLVGYENRDVADESFRDDEVDGGEIGSGHRVTALYEVELADPRPWGTLATVSVRWKDPETSAVDETSYEITDARLSPDFESAPADLRYAVGVMAVAEVLRGSALSLPWSHARIESMVCTTDDLAERKAFCELWRSAQGLMRHSTARVGWQAPY